jgi:hypothetical protein
VNAHCVEFGRWWEKGESKYFLRRIELNIVALMRGKEMRWRSE